MKHSFKKKIIAASFACALPLFSSQAEALTPITDWGLDLTGLNGTTVGATTYATLGSLTGLQDITVAGASTVTQELLGGSAVGQSFSDDGFLSWVGAKSFPSGASLAPAAFGAFLGTNDAVGFSNFNSIYFEFENLSGKVLNAGGDISFDTGGAQSGTVKLFLDSAGMDLSKVPGGVNGDRLELASFNLVPVSGGSGIGVDGGAFPSGTVGLTLDTTSILAGVVFSDSMGAPLGSDVLFNFVDVDATISTGAAFCTGAGGTGVCSTDPAVVDPTTAASFIQTGIQNEGSIVPATVPEPNTLALFAVSLISFGGFAKRYNKSK